MRRRTWKTVEREPVHDNKTSRRRFHRVYRPRTPPIFSPCIGRGGGEGREGWRIRFTGCFCISIPPLCTLHARTHARTYVYLQTLRMHYATCRWYASRECVRVCMCVVCSKSYACVWRRCVYVCIRGTLRARVCVCVWMCVQPRRISGHLITREERKSKPPERSASRRSTAEGSPLLSFSRGTMDKTVCYPIVWLHFFFFFFPTKEEARGGLCTAGRRGWKSRPVGESSRVSRSPIDWRYRAIFQIRKIA